MQISYNLRISFEVTIILMLHIVGTIFLLAFSVNDVTGINNTSTDISNTSSKSTSTELGPESGNDYATSQRTHSDLIRSCSTFREIMSTNMAFSCDYSMLYYKGQCEHYSSLLRQNETKAALVAKNDLSFCSDPRLDSYIQEHGLIDAPRSPSLVPGYVSPIA
jgi:hypothetical protein